VAVETEFALVRFKGDEEKAAMTYKGIVTAYSRRYCRIPFFYCAGLPENVCINDLVITCMQQAGSYYFHKTQ
jgi:NADP-dependent 3-hydroxy acid dehydrogenase YdfG